MDLAPVPYHCQPAQLADVHSMDRAMQQAGEAHRRREGGTAHQRIVLTLP